MKTNRKASATQKPEMIIKSRVPRGWKPAPAATHPVSVSIQNMPWNQRKRRLETATTYAEVCALSRLGDQPLISRVGEVVLHRNGISGQPFHTVTFMGDGGGAEGEAMFMATIFDYDPAREGALVDFNPFCAVVLCREAGAGCIERLYRGDNYSPFLTAIVRISER